MREGAARSRRGGDLNLQYIFEKLFCEPSGGGYPKERAVPEQRNKKIIG